MKWTQLTKKGEDLPLLIVDAAANGFIRYFTIFHDEKTKIRNYRQAFGIRSISEDDFLKYLQMYKNNETKIKKWTDDWVDKFKNFKIYVEKINGLDLKNKTNSQLGRIFKEYSEYYIKVCSYAYDYHFIGSFYPDKIITIFEKRELGLDKINSLMGLVLTLEKPIFINKEEFAFLNLAIKVKQKKLNEDLIKKQLKQHREKYGFLGMYLHEGELISLDVYQKRLNKLLKKSSGALSRNLFEKKNKFKKNLIAINQLKSELKLSDLEFRNIKTLRYVLFSSIYCDELYTYCAYRAKLLLQEISRRYGFAYRQLINMTHAEIQNLFKENLSNELLAKINGRLSGSMYLLKNNQVKILIGEKFKKYLKSHRQKLNKLKTAKLVRGESACLGRAKGRVQLIKKIEDIKKFKHGSILIATTTIPQYLPAMKKARAFVTDEGGLLSHAAIMSREFKKPCVIGTKIATEVFQDGDIVDVDANKGIVKKL